MTDGENDGRDEVATRPTTTTQTLKSTEKDHMVVSAIPEKK
jgi:hypothetical protein